MSDKHSDIAWLDDVAEHDYDAAFRYLSLKTSPVWAQTLVKRLRHARPEWFRANDILRAAGIDPAPRDDPGVRRAGRHMRLGRPVSPVLLVNLPVGCDIADGWHRVSAVYWIDPFADVPGRLA